VLVSEAVNVLQKDLTAGLDNAANTELAFSAATSVCCMNEQTEREQVRISEYRGKFSRNTCRPELGGYLGLWHEHDLRVDLVGVRLRLENPGKRVSTGPGIARRRGSGRARRGIGSEKPRRVK